MSRARESYIVIGGEGFLGHALVAALEKSHRGSAVASLDIVQRHFGTPSTPLAHSFHVVDLVDVDSLVSAFKATAATTVFHTASPPYDSPEAVCYKVNVDGTRRVVEACQRAGVQKLVYTSSASVVYTGRPLVGVDERMPYPEKDFDAYSASKAKAEEIVLKANGEVGVKTVALRPAGIFGPGDRMAIPGLLNVLKNGQTRIQVGSNSNLFDWTYIDNVVHAHLLAGERLECKVSVDEFFSRLEPVSKTVPRRKLPTSTNLESSHLASSDNEKTLITLCDTIDIPLEAKRTRFEQYSALGLMTSTGEVIDELSVAGEAFFITGGEPMFFWDFARAVWFEYNGHQATSVWVISRSIGLVLGSVASGFSQLLGRTPGFTRARVLYACSPRWFNIEKARVVLGYEPVVGVEEGIRKAVAVRSHRSLPSADEQN